MWISKNFSVPPSISNLKYFSSSTKLPSIKHTDFTRSRSNEQETNLQFNKKKSIFSFNLLSRRPSSPLWFDSTIGNLSFFGQTFFRLRDFFNHNQRSDIKFDTRILRAIPIRNYPFNFPSIIFSSGFQFRFLSLTIHSLYKPSSSS